jgi:hypothetical protein
MKKSVLLIASFLMMFIQNSTSQNVITVTGDISANTNWTNDNIYLLSGFVYVTGNSELNIQPGTIIKGDKASKGSLIVTRGSKLIADGTMSQPIVFTSNEPAGLRGYGDWGGIILCGKAPINDPAGEKVIEGGVDPVKGLYGGIVPGDNSGILRYVRIEFPGIAFMPNNEINGLTLGGVGNGTIIDHVQVSYSGDDAFECFGGTVNMKHLIAYRSLDDDFDTDFGFKGLCQFLVSIRDSNVADVSGSNGFESDNDATGTTNTPITQPVYSNVTIIGPLASSGTMINSNYKRLAHIRRSSKLSIFNSAFSGFPTGLLVDGANCENSATANELNFKNSVLAGCTTPLSVAAGSTWDITTWFNQAGFNNSILSNSSDLMLNNPFNYNLPDFMPAAGSPLLSGASFANAALADPFFDTVSYKGAFGATDWTMNWANYDCQNSIYTSIHEINDVSNVNIFPNPMQDKSTVRFNLGTTSNVVINVYSLDGKLTFTKNLGKIPAGVNAFELELPNMVSGIYSLQLLTDNGVSSYRISKN